MHYSKLFKTFSVVFLLLLWSGCASLFGTNNHVYETSKPIQNPFGNFYEAKSKHGEKGIVLRSRKGSRSVEVELPKENHEHTNFVIPVSPSQFNDRGIASIEKEETLYRDHKPGISDREIAQTFPSGSADQAAKQREIERQLGLRPAEEDTPVADTSYLGAIDLVKQLFRKGRYEAGLIEIDSLLRRYPTDPRLYEMRGTLLDRLGF